MPAPLDALLPLAMAAALMIAGTAPAALAGGEAPVSGVRAIEAGLCPAHRGAGTQRRRRAGPGGPRQHLRGGPGIPGRPRTRRRGAAEVGGRCR